jgi:hypothetical protein
MAVLKTGPAVKCRKCGKIYRTDLVSNQPLAKHDGLCDGTMQRGILTLYKYCPSGDATHDRSIITPESKSGGQREMDAQTHCQCGAAFKERERFSPSAP